MAEKENNEITLSTGVKLRGKPMPPGVFISLNVKNPPPEMPKYKSGDTFYTNPDDPGYIDQRQFWEEEKSKDMLNSMIIFGTELISISDKSVESLEGQDWIEKLALTGMDTLPENKSWRYLNWVLAVAAPTAADWDEITKVVGRLTGVPEDDVDSAAKFPGGEESGGDSASS